MAEIEQLEVTHASDYGWAFIHQVKACALHQLGQFDEADLVLSEKLVPLAEDNATAYAKALVCFDKLDEAADLLAKRLRDEEDRRYAITTFLEPVASKPGSPFYELLLTRAAEVRTKPAVASAAGDVARSIPVTGPASYWADF